MLINNSTHQEQFFSQINDRFGQQQEQINRTISGVMSSNVKINEMRFVQTEKNLEDELTKQVQQLLKQNETQSNLLDNIKKQQVNLTFEMGTMFRNLSVNQNQDKLISLINLRFKKLQNHLLRKDYKVQVQQFGHINATLLFYNIQKSLKRGNNQDLIQAVKLIF